MTGPSSAIGAGAAPGTGASKMTMVFVVLGSIAVVLAYFIGRIYMKDHQEE